MCFLARLSESLAGYSTAVIEVNPFIVVLAALLLGKRPVTVPNVKPLRLFLPLSHEHAEGFLSKWAVLKVGLL